MSNINNQTQDLYSIEAVQDLSHETAAAISGGAALELYDDSNFRRLLVQTNQGTRNVGDRVNDRITSIVVNEGVWRFYTDSQFRGVSADLGRGRYANIGLGIIPNDSITSFRRIR
ncbi:beta/gamma crystallin family protein [Nostoc sp. CHAB 5836]|uniref:beta/gamma crystallin-related protein n=1 Tax=Nostoc sp. CHAB 5836 TaxID=2780404 RepID=UPI001E4A1276|nr:beta/gamma crystallin-related protein [Nostoc sp. CHAB 5836]MCC5613997.1 beta/gamma crystallin family protein [Nostoc sp. CHAB 5836]